MGRRAATVLWVLVGIGVAAPAFAGAPSNPLVAAGDPIIAVVDADDNGNLTDPADCKVTAAVDDTGAMTGSGTLAVTADQTPVPPFDNVLQYCLETFVGPASVDSSSAEMNLSIDGNGNEQSVVTLLPNSSSSLSSGAGSGLPLLPVGAVSLQDLDEDPRGGAFLCNAGGPAVQVRLDSGVGLLFSLFYFPDSSDPTHICAPNVPFEVGFGQFDNHTICFPVDENGNTNVALQSDPGNPFIEVLFSNLPGCTLGRQAAPTTSELGLAALALALLAGGVALLRRRGNFTASLPLP